MVNFVEHDIPSKSALTKLQVRHAVQNAEATAIGTALQAVEKLTAAKTVLLDFLPALNALLAATKKFKTAYKSKHPKFIKGLEDDVEAPAEALLKKIEEVRKAPAGVKDWISKGEAKFMTAVKAVPDSLDPNSIAVIRKELEDAANLVSAAANQAQLVISKLGDVDPYPKVMTEIQSIKDTKNTVDRILVALQKAPNPSVKASDIKAAITTCLAKTTHINRLVKA